VIKRPGDKNPDPPGGRAAERLRMFEAARKPMQVIQKENTKGRGKSKLDESTDNGPNKTGKASDAEQDRRKD
jgi:hypothetical protein